MAAPRRCLLAIFRVFSLYQALRLYQLVDAKVAGGAKLLIEDGKKDRVELMMI
jgi:hypothetical protein